VTARPAAPRQYRLHVYDGEYEVLHDRQHVITLDMDGHGVDLVLAQQLQALTRAALAANETMDAPRLVVVDVATGERVRDWTGA
jgi:predicted naringenin-chalcone synthase